MKNGFVRIVLLLGVVAMFGGITAMVISTNVEALAPVRVTARGTASAGASFLGEKGAKRAASLGATTAGLGNWAKAARKACRNGYSIVAGSAQHKLVFKVVTSYGGFWVSVTATYTVSIEIECDDRGKFPAAPVWDSEYGKLTQKDIDDYNTRIAGAYNDLKRIKTAAQLIKKVRYNKIRGADYSEFEKAVRDGKIKGAQVPSLAELTKVHIGFPMKTDSRR